MHGPMYSYFTVTNNYQKPLALAERLRDFLNARCLNIDTMIIPTTQLGHRGPHHRKVIIALVSDPANSLRLDSRKKFLFRQYLLNFCNY
jgi:hypothetical protein